MFEQKQCTFLQCFLTHLLLRGTVTLKHENPDRQKIKIRGEKPLLNFKMIFLAL